MHTNSLYRKKQKGATAVTVGAMMLMLLSFAALALDIGNVMVAKNELQNAADAAALAAAPCLYPRAQCGNSNNSAPDWTTAEQKAKDSVALNYSQGTQLSVGVASSGYWNITGNPGVLEPPPFTPTSNDYPAVRVSITKTNANANGAVSMVLAKLFGVNSMSLSATATAVVASPGTAGPGSLFPLAISQCMYDNYWDPKTDQPKTAPNSGTVTGFPYTKQVQGQPYFFQIGSSYHNGVCASGQWTTFNSTDNSASYARTLLNGGNQTTLAIGQAPGTYVQNGTEDTLFQGTKACSAAGNGKCEWVMVPVIPDPTAQGVNQVVTAFACLHILDETGNGKNAFVLVQMANNPDKCQLSAAGGVGPAYGALMPPRLVQ